MRSIRILIATSILGISSLVSFAASGELDRSFGTGQNGMTHFDTPYPISALAVLPDDRFIGGDQCSQIGFGSHFCMIRYTVDGAIDTTFGAYGIVFTQMASVGNESSTIVKLLVQSDGKIIAGGYTQRTVGSNTYNYIAVARYFPDGTLDTTFADQGKFFNLGTAVPTGMRLVDMALRPDGKLVILAGWPSITASGSRVVLLRLNASGALDSTFGTGGRAARDYGSLSDYAGSIALGPDGKIVGGSQGTSEIRFVFEKYLSNADYDVSAGQNGRISFYGGTSSLVRRVRILPDGSTIALGNSFNFAHPTMMITRLKPDLSFDASFAGTGLPFTNLAANNSCEGIDFQPRSDGRITLMANCSISSSTFFGASQEVARLRQDGSLDPQFGVGGRIVKLYRTYTGNSIVQSTGKIVVCGRTTQQSGPLPGAFCERYLDNGTREADFDADKKADVSVFRPSTGIWYSNRSRDGFKAIQFGSAGDKIVPADYDGDGIVGQAVFRQGVWYQLLSLTNSVRIINYGLATDVPLAADYTGDGKADVAVFRDGDWYILDGVSGQSTFVHYGLSGDKPQVGNFDGDLRADPTVCRNGTWYSLGSTAGSMEVRFGLSSDRPVPLDYDGDGLTDRAIYRDGAWHILGSISGYRVVTFGLATDRPTPADYDGDERADIAVYRDGLWYLQQSTAGFSVINFGLADDVPIPAAFSN